MLTLQPYVHLTRLNKPIGILLLLWPTLWALWLAADGVPGTIITAIFIGGVILMRSAGCIINDFADRHFDGRVKRTENRPLATGKISTRSALSLFLILSLCAFLLVLQLNRLTIHLAFIGMVLAVVYPFLKRVTHLPQLGLGLAFAWGVPMAFAAELNSVPTNTWLVFLAAAIWPVIYDTMYAMVDREDDLTIGVKSTAILFASYDKLIILLLQLLFLFLLIVIGYVFVLHAIYFVSLIGVLVLFIYQQFLIRQQNDGCFKAFLNNNWVGLIIFLGIVLSYLA